MKGDRIAVSKTVGIPEPHRGDDPDDPRVLQIAGCRGRGSKEGRLVAEAPQPTGKEENVALTAVLGPGRARWRRPADAQSF
jgi:hypothetical protein